MHRRLPRLVAKSIACSDERQGGAKTPGQLVALGEGGGKGIEASQEICEDEQSSSGLGQRAHQRRFVSVASTFGEQRNRGPSVEFPPSGRMREGCSTYVWKMYTLLAAYRLISSCWVYCSQAIVVQNAVQPRGEN